MTEVSIEERIRNLPRLARNVMAGKGVISLKASGNRLTVSEVDKLLKEHNIDDVQERMAVKLDLEAAGFMEGTRVPKSPYV